MKTLQSIERSRNSSIQLEDDEDTNNPQNNWTSTNGSKTSPSKGLELEYNKLFQRQQNKHNSSSNQFEIMVPLNTNNPNISNPSNSPNLYPSTKSSPREAWGDNTATLHGTSPSKSSAANNLQNINSFLIKHQWKQRHGEGDSSNVILLPSSDEFLVDFTSISGISTIQVPILMQTSIYFFFCWSLQSC